MAVKKLKEKTWYRITWRGFSGRTHKMKRRVQWDQERGFKFKDEKGKWWILCPAINRNVVKVKLAKK